MDGWQMILAVTGDWIFGPKKERLFWTPDSYEKYPRHRKVLEDRLLEFVHKGGQGMEVVDGEDDASHFLWIYFSVLPNTTSNYIP
jgi:hypothetical protein